jgi:3-methyladenine DNA glycosylase AlkD
MIKEKFKEIRSFCEQNACSKEFEKYAKYFKGDFDGYGIQQKVFEKQRDVWIKQWEDEMTLEDYLDLGDLIYREGRFEEKSLVIAFINSKRKMYSKETFKRITNWFETGIDNWASTDVLCMLVLSSFLKDKVIGLKELMIWNDSSSEWQRRAVPVTLVELLKSGFDAEEALSTIEPLMLDESEYVQKGIGTLLRNLWKKYPELIEVFLLKWKDQCARIIIQYATEKMDKEYRKKFRKKK